jgi:hypothetical protein
MKRLHWALVAAAGVAAGTAGCGSRNDTATPADPTPEQVRADKEWRDRVDEEEKRHEKSGLRGKDYDPNYLKVQEEERAHRRETGAAGSPTR